MNAKGFLTTAIAIAFLVGPDAAMAQAPRVVAIVLKTKNEVRQRAPGADWAAVAKGAPLRQGDQLRTGDNSFCAIIFQDDQSLLKLTANTEVKLDAKPAPGGGISKNLYVAVGGVWAKVKEQGEREFVVETPTSVASVKGTEGYDMVDEAGLTTLFGLEGEWDFSNPFGGVTVPPGFQGFSNGVDPPTLLPTPPGEAPTFSSDNPIPGVDDGAVGEGDEGGEQGKAEGGTELRIGMEDEDGTARTLVIRYRVPQSEQAPADTTGNGGDE